MGECFFWYRPTRVVPDQRPLNGCCCCCIVKEGFIPEYCRLAVPHMISEGNGDPMECGFYRVQKLFEHAIKVVKRTFEHRIRQKIEIDDMQFRFRKGKGITDAIFMVRQMQENFRVKGKKLCFGFVDLEKAFDRIPRGDKLGNA